MRSSRLAGTRRALGAAARRLGAVRRPTLVRWLAGRAGGMPAGRRGSVLVLVLGALAMLAVVTVIYATVGQETRRTSGVVQRRDTIDVSVRRIADYLASVVADDALSTHVQTVDTNSQPVIVREQWDYPFTDPRARSVLSVPTPSEFPFNPMGTTHAANEVGALPSDPWLASTEPASLDPDNNADNTTYRDNAVDWPHVSNLSPDGRFVNLFNLRPEAGGFDCPPGIRDGETSDGLSFIDEGGGLVVGSEQQRNVPWLWDSYQREAFWPVGDGGQPPSRPQYLPYQWADADGDGFFDSRWFELVDASDPQNIFSILPRDERFRWFVAARVVDLSAMVNVNTATELRLFHDPGAPHYAMPREVVPLGLSPADIDLRRLLMLDDVYGLYNDEGYDLLLQGTGVDDYSGYDRARAFEAGQWGYNGLRAVVNPVMHWAISPPGNPDQPLDWLDDANFDVRLIDDHFRPSYYRIVGAHLAGAGFGPNDPLAGTPDTYFASTLFGPSDLFELLAYRGLNNPERTSRLEAAVGGRYAGDEWASPLRSNRLLDVERDGHDLDGDGAPDPHARVWSAVDVRQRLTTISSARPLVSGLLRYDPAAPTDDPDSLDQVLRRLRAPANGQPGEVRTSALEALAEATRDVQDHTDTPGMGDGVRDRRSSPAALFEAYLDVLAPYSGLPGAWDAASSPYATAHYGGLPVPAGDPLQFRRTPELAVRLAAHLTANLIDAHDRDLDRTGGLPGLPRHQPSAFVLILGNPAGIANNPWFMDGRRGHLRVPSTHGPAMGQPVTRNVVNVFGIEPQPFITEAATMFAYTDAPPAAGGDDDSAGEVTIDGTIPPPTGGTDNPDFLFGIFAVQLINPFDVPVRLTAHDLAEGDSAAGGGFSDYYLEFGGHVFKLAELDTSGGVPTPTAIALDAGESKVVYALMVPPVIGVPGGPFEHLAARLQRIDTTLTITPDTVRDIIRKQFGITDPTSFQVDDPILIGRMDPVTGGLNLLYTDLLAKDPTTGGTNVAENKSVLLWRVMRSRNVDEDPASDNIRSNDLLADRLAQPSRIADGPAALARRMPADPTDPQNEVGNSAGDHDRGYSLALWNTVKRSDNPPNAGGTNEPPTGAIPAYCIEPRWEVPGNINALRNHDHDDGIDEDALEKTDFDPGEENSTPTYAEFINKIKPEDPPVFPPRAPLIGTITRHPKHKNDPQDVLAGFENRYTQIALNNREFRTLIALGTDNTEDTPDDVTMPTMRLADLLMPLCVGPTWAAERFGSTGDDPSPNPSSNSDHWMTLSESLALALRYSEPTPTDERFGLLAGWMTDANNPTDRGNLRLDRYVPFIDADQSGTFDPAQDVRLAPGIPLALTLFDRFTALEPELGGLTRGTPGLININTAPLAVLRLLPLLSPNQTTSALAGLTWPTNIANDIAVTLAAYRDKMLLPDRTSAATAAYGPDADPDDPATWTGRYDAHGQSNVRFVGLREQPGFASVGEVLATAGGGPNAMVGVPLSHRIDTLRHDGIENGAPGLGLAFYDHDGDGGVTTPRVADGIIDDYTERLMLASAIAQSVTVRSDTYAVWFVVHGYQRADVEGLTPDDPLVPSVAKRFVMVLDRSNVKERGQKPRVLLFKEVPM